jgi:PTH1 family peptidyl-tRNA hydrolase
VALRRPRDPSTRRGSASDLVIVGLANPGAEFQGSRHNVGGDAVRLLAERHGQRLVAESRQRCVSCSFAAPVGRVTLAVPTTYMNESGSAMPNLLRRTSLGDLGALVVAHDELDLEPGRLQLKLGGGLAGHNGLRSIAQVLGSTDFARLRIGIGKPPTKQQGTDWVLRAPTGARRRALEEQVAAAADALESLCELGIAEAQRRINAAVRD